jgi:hypothetical protein
LDGGRNTTGRYHAVLCANLDGGSVRALAGEVCGPTAEGGASGEETRLLGGKTADSVSERSLGWLE